MVHEPTIRSILNGEKSFPQDDSFLALLYMVRFARYKPLREEADKTNQ